MHTINIHHTYQNTSHFGERLFLFFKTQHKKVVLVATIALSCLAACYLSIRYLKINKLAWQKKEEKNQKIVQGSFQNTQISQSLSKKSSLESIPSDILSCSFTFLGKKEWNALALTNRLFHILSQTSTVINSLLENNFFPLTAIEKLAKIANFHPLTLNLENLDDSPHALESHTILQQLLKKHSNIIKFHFKRVFITDLILASLPSHLQSLILYKCKWSSSSILDRLPPGLQFLTFSWCKLENTTLAHLPSNLQSLKLVNCHSLTDAALTHLPLNLRTLDLSLCTQFSEAALAHLPPHLESLNLSACHQLTDTALAHLPSDLQSLSVSYCRKLSDEALSLLPSSLLLLDLSYCNQLTDDSLIHLPLHLQSLNLSACPQFTDTALDRLPSSLQFLNLTPCTQFSNDGLTRLKLRLSNLKINLKK